jgi:hypothetical protein
MRVLTILPGMSTNVEMIRKLRRGIRSGRFPQANRLAIYDYDTARWLDKATAAAIGCGDWAMLGPVTDGAGQLGFPAADHAGDHRLAELNALLVIAAGHRSPARRF